VNTEQARLSDLFDSMAAGVYATDDDGRVLTMNAEALRLLGRDGQDLTGRRIHELIHHSTPEGQPLPRGSCPLLAVVRTGVAARSDDDTFWKTDGSPLHVSWLAAPNRTDGVITGAVVVFSDATTRHIETQRLRIRQQEQAMAAERLALLGRVSEALSTLDPEEALRRLARVTAGAAADWIAVDSCEDGAFRRVALARADRAQPELTHAQLLPPLTPGASSALALALTGRRQQLLNADEWEPVDGAPLDQEQAALFAELGMAHALVTPLLARQEVVGAMTWVRLEESEPFTQADVFLAAEVARRAGTALENARLYGQQRQVAETLQRSFLTLLPEPDHLQVAARYLPATDQAEIGGDWYDAFTLEDGATSLVIGDIGGHDLTAASYMGQVRNILRGIGYDRSEPPSEVMRRLDVALDGLRVDVLATCLLARIEQDEELAQQGLRLLRWTNAGHLPPALVSAEGQVQLLEEPTDIMLGVAPSSARHDFARTICPGDTIWLYTDGLVERSDQPLDVGLVRLRQALAAAAALPLEQACDDLLARMLPAGHPDDVALLAVRAHPQDRPRPPEAGPAHP
jgi:PAS domain S-box-containing protein